MLILTRILPADPTVAVVAVLALTAAERTRSRHRFVTESGLPVMLNLPRGNLLRNHTLLASEAGEMVRVVAKPEPVVVVRAASPWALLRAAYHLGNRHVPLELNPDHLKLEPDTVLEAMLRQLGELSLQTTILPFEPEDGAYRPGASRHHHYESHTQGHPHASPAGHPPDDSPSETQSYSHTYSHSVSYSEGQSHVQSHSHTHIHHHDIE